MADKILKRGIVMKTPSTLRINQNDPMLKLMSNLWVFLSLNYILCDVLSNMEKSVIRMLLEGNVGGIPMTEGMLLFAGISLEIPFAMVLLTTVLPYKANRIANMIAAILMVIYQLGSFFFGSDVTLHYTFFSAVEILGNMALLVLAFRWKQAAPEAKYDL
jgi:hypothetical protein